MSTLPAQKRLFDRLRVFVSSRMTELAPERRLLKDVLDEIEVDAWVFEVDAGARPESIQQTFLGEVERADLYLGLFWKGYGSYTVQEYEHARKLGKPCLVYEKRAGLNGQRDPRLQQFLDRISDVEAGLTPAWFNTPEEVAEQTRLDVLRLAQEAFRRREEHRRGFTPSAVDKQDLHNLRLLSEKVRRFWVEGVLEKTLYGEALIDLGKAIHPDAIDHPWARVLEQPYAASQVLPPGKALSDVFDEVGRLLLILGGPGSGKTVTLLTLARDLLARAARDPAQPVPVVFHLSTWTDTGRPFADWLAVELSDKYQIPERVGRVWLTQNRLVVLLDGLDEVAVPHRAACVRAVNAFAPQGGLAGLTVCSRLHEYTALPERLRATGAIELQPLTPQQVDAYLAEAGPRLAALRTLLPDDDELQQLARTPLMLGVMSLAYQGISAETLSSPRGTRRQHLFAAYLKRMFERRRRADLPYSDAQTLAGLAWLARHLLQHNQTLFLLEKMQPSWLDTAGQRRLYALGSRLLEGALFGLVGGLSLGLLIGELAWEAAGSTLREFLMTLAGSLGLGLAGGLGIGLIRGLLFARKHTTHQDIKTAEALRWSWEGARRRGLWGLLTGLGLGLMTATIWILTEGLGDAEGAALLFLLGSTTALLGGVLGALFGGVRTDIVTKTVPNQGMILSRRNALLAGLRLGLATWLAAGLIGALLAGTGQGAFGALGYGLLQGLAWGLAVGLLGGLFYGGLDVLRHYLLRWILYRYGDMPRDYIGFLNYAALLVFLQQVGGGYQFVHRFFLNSFAAMDASAEEATPPAVVL